MSDKVWKQLERDVAAAFGVVRNRVSGAVDQLTRGDVVHRRIYFECKYSKRHAIVTLMKETRRRADVEGKIGVVVLQEAGNKTRYYLVAERDIDALSEELRSPQK